MNASTGRGWARAALLVGLVYFVVGRVFARPSTNVLAWRWAAWVVSGIVFAAHIWYEQFKLRNSPRMTALHAAVAVGLGAFGLAVAGMIHTLQTTSAIRPVWFLALVLWPLFTAIPAFLAALVASMLLARVRRVHGPTT
jgi:hypothetical protein